MMDKEYIIPAILVILILFISEDTKFEIAGFIKLPDCFYISRDGYTDFPLLLDEINKMIGDKYDK